MTARDFWYANMPKYGSAMPSSTLNFADDYVAAIISKHIPEQNEWVKVTDRLPESEDPIWTYDGRCVRSGYLTDSASFGDADYPEFHNGVDVLDGVNAWMPMEIPTPPRFLATPSEPLGVTKEKK